MPKVNFYLLKDSDEAARRRFACRLAEQQTKQGQRVYLLATSQAEALELDQLLWSFAPESFVPHALVSTAEATTSVPALIGYAPRPDMACVLNLSDAAVSEYAGLSTIAEFVLNADDAKAHSRTRWNHYKQLGFELQLHQL
jgi:DNA polymerase III subunit chi